jgi:hypothetical protein
MDGVVAAALSCTLHLFGFTVTAVLEKAEEWVEARDLDVVELWSGVEAITRAAINKRFRARAFDVIHSPTEDITTEAGFNLALRYVLRLRPSGLLAMAPVCSSFTFPNTSNTKRTKSRVQGDIDYEPVRAGNLMANIAAFFLAVAVARGVHCSMENPAGSLMFSFLAPTLRLFPFLVAGIADRCAYSEEPFGERFKKPYKFMATGDWIRAMARKCSCPNKEHAHLMTDVDGKKTGNLSLMKASQAYPDALGVALVDAWSRAPALEHQVQSLELVECQEDENPWDNVGEDAPAGAHTPQVLNSEPIRPLNAADIDDNPWLDVDEGRHNSADCNPFDTQRLSKIDADSNPWDDDDQGNAFRNYHVATMQSTESDDDPWAEFVQPHKRARQV